MNSFLNVHDLSLSGVINTFDRVIFKGHLNGFFLDGAFGRYLSRRGILLKDPGPFFEAETQRIRDRLFSGFGVMGSGLRRPAPRSRSRANYPIEIIF
jgi:hypothetical protein